MALGIYEEYKEEDEEEEVEFRSRESGDQRGCRDAHSSFYRPADLVLDCIHAVHCWLKTLRGIIVIPHSQSLQYFDRLPNVVVFYRYMWPGSLLRPKFHEGTHLFNGAI